MKLMPILTFALVGPIMVACNDNGFKSGGGAVRKAAEQKPAIQSIETETFTLKGEQIESGKIDVVFVVDTSGSMYQEKELLERNMAAFLREFESKNQSMDYIVHLIGRNFSFPTGGAKVNLVDQSVGSNDALAILYNFIHSGYNGQAIRAGSIVEAIIITDDNAHGSDNLPIQILPYPSTDPYSQNISGEVSTLNAREFSELIKQNHAQLNLHINGLVGKQEGRVNDWCHITEAGTEYETLAAMPQFAGLVADLCREDWSPLLTELATNIIKRVEQSTVKLSRRPNLSRGYTVTFNGQVVEPSKVAIDANGQITLLDEALKRQSGTLVINYTAQS